MELEFRTGTGFAFDVLVDRCFDVGRCEFAGPPLSWLSASGVVAPWYYEPDGGLRPGSSVTGPGAAPERTLRRLTNAHCCGDHQDDRGETVCQHRLFPPRPTG